MRRRRDRPAAERGLKARAFAAAIVWCAANTAHAECAGQTTPRWLVHQSLVLLLNPVGAELNTRGGLCWPLYASDDAARRLNHIEVGATTYVSPIYAIGGGYAQIVPFSPLLLRAEVAAVGVWPIPLNGAGYYARAGYDDGFESEDLPTEHAEAAGGWSVRLIAVLRGRIDLTPTLALLAVDASWIETNRVGGASHWVDVRNDVIAAREDWIVANEAVIALGTRIPDGPELRTGVYSALRAVPSSGYVGHQLGPIAMLSWSNVDRIVRDLDVFVRFGFYTHHAFRVREAATLAGLAIDWDLGGL